MGSVHGPKKLLKNEEFDHVIGPRAALKRKRTIPLLLSLDGSIFSNISQLIGP